MNIPRLKLCFYLLLVSVSAWAQAAPSTAGMQTYSPYTPEQIKEFNSQSLSPVEGPFGTVDPKAEDLRLPKGRALDAKFYNQPEGEEEAEVLETQSVDPYQSTQPVIAF